MLGVQLPSSFLKVLDLERLEVENSHFIDEQMTEVESDLLFRIPRIDRSGQDCYVYVLWEHQRRRDSLMMLRMWIYLGMIYSYLARDGHLLPGNKLPFVYPIVLFQGTEGWSKGLSLRDLIDLDGLDPTLDKWVPSFEIDLIRLDEDSPRITPNDQLAALGLGLMTAVMNRRVYQWLDANLDQLNTVFPDHVETVTLILSYALKSGAGLTKSEFLTIVREKGSKNMDYEIGSVADQLVKQGEAQGEARGESNIVAKLIGKGLSDAEVADLTDLPLNTIADIRHKSK